MYTLKQAPPSFAHSGRKPLLVTAFWLALTALAVTCLWRAVEWTEHSVTRGHFVWGILALYGGVVVGYILRSFTYSAGRQNAALDGECPECRQPLESSPSADNFGSGPVVAGPASSRGERGFGTAPAFRTHEN